MGVYGQAAIAGVVGVIIGRLLGYWVDQMTPRPALTPEADTNSDALVTPASSHAGEYGVCAIGTGMLFATYWLSMTVGECQRTPAVQPDPFWFYGRILYHLVLITLLVAATWTDFREYVIPDQITVTGMLIGVILAGISGQLQTIHLWVDWNQEIPGIRGPYIPGWFDQYRQLHGLAWSLAGFIVGGGLTWLVRALSGLLLGQEALGFGDVTLMAMIGSFVGWQPVVFVFLLAPLCGICIALFLRITQGRLIVPYGPYLSASTLLVLCSWRWLWTPTRDIFGDAISLAILGGVALVVFVALLLMMRLYRMIPVQNHLFAQAETADADKANGIPKAVSVDDTAKRAEAE